MRREGGPRGRGSPGAADVAIIIATAASIRALCRYYRYPRRGLPAVEGGLVRSCRRQRWHGRLLPAGSGSRAGCGSIRCLGWRPERGGARERRCRRLGARVSCGSRASRPGGPTTSSVVPWRRRSTTLTPRTAAVVVMAAAGVPYCCCWCCCRRSLLPAPSQRPAARVSGPVGFRTDRARAGWRHPAGLTGRLFGGGALTPALGGPAGLLLDGQAAGRRTPWLVGRAHSSAPSSVGIGASILGARGQFGGGGLAQRPGAAEAGRRGRHGVVC